MTSIRPMKASDLLDLEHVNLNDPFVTTFGIAFYLEYLAKWPQYCHVLQSRGGQIHGYIIGKSESSPPRSGQRPTALPYSPDTNTNMHYLPWHAHITALAIAPEARGQGHARRLTDLFEDVADREGAWFVDLFVRRDNAAALGLYRKCGYSVFRKVVQYYQDDSDAFDMRKPMAKDVRRQHVREGGEGIEVDPRFVW